jgi:ribonuclease J
VQENGEVIRLAPNGPVKIGNEQVGRLILDGDVILAADGATMNQRRKISINGVISAAVAVDGQNRLRGSPSCGCRASLSRKTGLPLLQKPAMLSRPRCAAAMATRQAARVDPACRTPLRDRLDRQEAHHRCVAGAGLT